MLRLAIIITALFATACMGSRTMAVRTPYDAQVHAPFNAQGSATVTGQAFHRTVGGDVRYAAGRKVELLPATDYGREVIGVLRAGKVVENFDPEWRKGVRVTTANGEGEFTFRDVPPGEWFILTSNMWNAGGSVLYQGGYLGKLVTVPESGEIEAIVTGPPW